MKNYKLATAQILAIALIQFMQLNERDGGPIYKYRDGSYSFIPLQETDDAISQNQFVDELIDKIEGLVQANKIIVLYICPDNELIIITDKYDGEDVSMFDLAEISGYDSFYTTKD